MAFDYRSCCFYASWTIVASICFILCVTLLVGGTELYRHREQTMSFSMAPSVCHLQSYEISECGEDQWVATYNGGRIVEHPFVARYTKELANLAAQSYPLNASYPCMCPPQTSLKKCQIWNACTLNINLTRHLQLTGAAYTYGGDILVAIGSIILVTVVFATFLMVITREWCTECCCRGRTKRRLAEAGVFVIGDEDEIGAPEI